MTWIIVIGCIFLYFVVVVGLFAFIDAYNSKVEYSKYMDDIDILPWYACAIFWVITAIPVLLYFLVFKKIYHAIYSRLGGVE